MHRPMNVKFIVSFCKSAICSLLCLAFRKPILKSPLPTVAKTTENLIWESIEVRRFRTGTIGPSCRNVLISAIKEGGEGRGAGKVFI